MLDYIYRDVETILQFLEVNFVAAEFVELDNIIVSNIHIVYI